MTSQAGHRHFHGRPMPIRPPHRFPIKPQQMLVLSLGLLAMSLASILAYFIATGYHLGAIILQTPQIQKWHWLTQIAV